MWIETESGELVNLDLQSRITVKVLGHIGDSRLRNAYQVQARDTKGEWVALAAVTTEVEARTTLASISRLLPGMILRPAREPAP